MTPSFSPALLLAGPVLRKVTPSSVSVWVATSQPCDVKLDVYGSAAFLKRDPDAQFGTVAANLVGGNVRPTVKVGDALHIAVVTAAIAGVPPDTICSYNVTFLLSSATGGQWDLGGLKLLDQGDPADDYQGGLGYAEGRLPSFATPPADVASLRLYHGSCFKLHGDGPSIMSNLDDLLGDALQFDAPAADGTSQKQRPHMLLLTGDQIYADEVATPLLPLLTSIGANLLRAPGSSAAVETVPVPGATPADQPVDQTTFPAGQRQRLVRKTAGMTTDVGHNHVIGFGEWAALYLLSWSGRLENRLVGSAQPLWPENLAVMAPTDPTATVSVKDGNPPEAIAPNPDGGPRQTAQTGTPVTLDQQPKPSPIASLLTPLFTSPAGDVLRKLIDEFPTQRTDVTKVGDDGEKVRRALANIPVLTVCDDHEVTDDWFMTGAWRARVLSSPLGRAMVRNALIAYVLFQAWGNTPEAFHADGTPEAQFLALVPKLFGGTGKQPDPDVCRQVEHLLGLDDATGTSTDPRIAFNYHVDLAGVRLVVLDTRTRREYGTPNGPPGLLTQSALDAQLPISLTDDVPLLILVSPAPVLGPRLIEQIMVPGATRGYDLYHMALHEDAAARAAAGYDAGEPAGDAYFDVEFWAARQVSFERFLARITRCPQVVILAGDVHYAASFAMDYQRFPPPAGAGDPTPIEPPPNTTTSRVVNFTSSALRNAWLPWVATIARTIGIIENLTRVGFDGLNLGWTRITPPVLTGDDAPGEARTMRARLRREPVILPTEGWKNRHSIRPPEWQYRVSPLIDSRTDDQRFADLATAGFTQTLGPGVPDAPPPPADASTSDSLVGPGGPYEVAATLHAANVDGAVVTRTLVFDNNVGVVTFDRPDPSSPLSVQMAIYFVRPHPVSEDEKPDAYVVHSTSLAPNPIPAVDHFGGPPDTSVISEP